VASDGGAGLVVLDPHGRILFINAVAARVFARRSAREVIGERLSDLMPAPAAVERAEYVRQVAASGEPLVVRDVWGGYALRCTLRRVENYGDAPGPAVAMICCPESALLEESQGAGAGEKVVEARNVDLGPLAGLTTSELKVLALIGEGMSNAEIANRLHRAVKTVESHRAALTEKTGATSRVQLGLMARRAGLARRVPGAERDRGEPRRTGVGASRG